MRKSEKPLLIKLRLLFMSALYLSMLFAFKNVKKQIKNTELVNNISAKQKLKVMTYQNLSYAGFQMAGMSN